jgi:hypothetical protein
LSSGTTLFCNTDRKRRLGIDRFAKREHLVGAGIADAHRHQQARCGLRHQRQIDERRRELGVFGKQDEIAMQ